MKIEGSSVLERTQGFRTKKELQEAIADGTAFRIRIKKKLTKVTTPTKVSKEIIPESSSSDGVPIWVWFVVGIVAVVVISNLTK